MTNFARICGSCAAACLVAIVPPCLAADDSAGWHLLQGYGATLQQEQLASPKAASAQTLGTRATVTSSATLFGGFEISNSTTVYILIRGNSLGTLGVTQGYLDLPRLRVFNAQGQDLVFAANGSAGLNFCLSTNSLNSPVVSYYSTVRGQAVSANDACLAASFPAGVYTFTVTPSIPGVTTVSSTSVPSFGEVLFEVTLNP